MTVRPSRLSPLLGAALALLVLASAGAAQAQGRTLGARSMGMGEAITANASGTNAIYQNPAGVATMMTYTFEGSYLYEPGMNTFNAAVVDSKLNPRFALGLAYSYDMSSDEDLKLTGHDARAALGTPIIPNRLALGLGARYLNYTGTINPATNTEGELVSAFTLDAGTIIRITDGFFAGISGSNLLDVCEGDANASCPQNLAPRTLGGGLSFGSSLGVLVSGEARADMSDTEDVSWIYAGGLELFMEQFLAFRAGYRSVGSTDANIVSSGLGLKSNTAGLDVGYQYDFTSKESRAVVALQLFMLN